MKVWKCKKCGCTEFEQQVSGGYSTIYTLDAEGYPEEHEDDIDYANEICCNSCGNVGENIKDIANYVEEEE